MRPNFKLGISLAAGIAVLALGGIAAAGAAKPGLEAQIASAESEASLISQRISSQSARLGELEAEAAEAVAREQELRAQLRDATARSTELNGELVGAERELEDVRARYDRSVGVLGDRLVAIYKAPEPDLLAVILEAQDYEEVQGRAEYLEALTDADERTAERVAALHDEVDARYEEITGIKDGIDEQSGRLERSRAGIAAESARSQQRAAEMSDARADARAALADLQERISGWELEVRRQAAEEIEAGGGEAFLGGPYSIPTYIVICESGGNYRALNPSSGAGGAYQILPSTWRAYGGQGLPHQASKAEQDRVAAIIWREDGPGAWSCA
ncbi:MAG: transglycosylase family protein [Actinomycetota bacterium]|nr:transglycosylase family protein [Actinomycetota bacterium]